MRRVFMVSFVLFLLVSLASCKVEASKKASPTPTCKVSPNDFLGSFQDSWSQRASMEVTQNGRFYHFEINWANSAFETVTWRFTAVYDATSCRMYYKNGKRIELLFEEGAPEPKETIIYENGTGYFELRSGKLYWKDFTQNVGKNLVFLRIPIV